MRAAEALYAAALAVDRAARLKDPLHAFSDAIIPAAEFSALCRALRACEKHATEEGRDDTPRTRLVR
jgi:hypothetical protein